jgi:hypothetical protein
MHAKRHSMHARPAREAQKNGKTQAKKTGAEPRSNNDKRRMVTRRHRRTRTVTTDSGFSQEFEFFCD